MKNGYWVKFEIKRVDPSEAVPHAIRYSLSLHNPRNQRVLGYDNAHKYKPKEKRFGAQKSTYDHIHKREEVLPYEFEDAG